MMKQRCVFIFGPTAAHDYSLMNLLHVRDTTNMLASSWFQPYCQLVRQQTESNVFNAVPQYVATQQGQVLVMAPARAQQI